MKPFNLALGIPAYRGTLASGHAKMWLEIGASAAFHVDEVKIVTFLNFDICRVDRARNFLLAHAMKEGAEWLLMVDSDTWVEKATSIMRMIVDANSIDAAIVGAPVYRAVDGKMSLNVLRIGSESTRPQVQTEKSLGRATSNLNPLVEVWGIGAAVMAIDLRKIGDAEFRFTDELSEDLDFCRQIANRGGRIYCDPRVETKHMKTNTMNYSL